MHTIIPAVCFTIAGIVGAVTPNHQIAWVGVALGGLFFLLPVG